MRTPFVAGNWKMNKTLSEATELARSIVDATAGISGVDMVVSPTTLCLSSVIDAVRGSNVDVSSQNIHWAEKGAYTGELSPTMALDAGCKYTILGHSERREYFGESDQFIHRKLQSALSHGLIPILCIGETLDEREAGNTQTKVDFQVRAALSGVSPEDAATVVIAYEPIWAIGTGRTASSQQAQEVHGAIRALLTSLYDGAVASKIRILYGGSVKPSNVDELIAQPDIDGALVGGASMKADSFAAIARACA